MKIFVGHSFAERDEMLINSIVSFLSKKGGISIETGEKAQNKSVSEKVKLRIGRNDIFLGVFTIDQEIKQIEETKPPESFLSKFIPQKPKVTTLAPLFTTSNWVLQESGYAIAKGKKIILMVEDGIHKFPELQGDTEIIPFNRSSLDKPFLRLIEMLLDDTQLGSVVGKATSPSTESKESSKDEENQTPPFMEMFDAHEQKDLKKAEAIYQEKIRATLGDKQQKFWDALILRWKYSAGEADKFNELEKMYNETKEYDVAVQIGICYETFDKYEDARQFYFKCLKDTTDNHEKFDYYLRIARSYVSEKDFDKATSNLLALINNPDFTVERERAFLDLVEIAEERKDDYQYFIFAEKALDINPVNNSLRFKVAYKYSNTEKPDLALYHYKKLENTEDNMAVNNMGVAYGELDMPSKAIKSYEKASAKKNTLSNANLAYKYLNTGFVEQADKLLKDSDALSKEGIEVHENIGYAKKALKDKIEAEDKRETEVIEQVSKAHAFKLRHSEAYCKISESVINLSGKWHLGEWGDIDIKWNKDGTFTGLDSKEIEVPSQDFGFGMGLLGLITSAPTIKIRTVEIKGSINNLAGRFTLIVKETIKGAAPSTLLSSGLEEVYNSKGLFIIDATSNTVDAMEEVKNKERIYNQYKRV